jgi:Holliday junction resolvasome RuvABC endonuclease subunit
LPDIEGDMVEFYPMPGDIPKYKCMATQRILGFDASSSTIGFAVLDLEKDTNEVRFICCDYYKPPKKGDILERLLQTKKDIYQILDKWKPDYIAIEDIVQFMGGGSTAATIIILTSFNRMVGLTCLEYSKKSPKLFSVMAIRHGIKLADALPKKEEIPEVVATHLKMEPFLHYKKNGNIAIETYDMNDAIAVALYCSKILTGEIVLKEKKPKKKKKKGKKVSRECSASI